jgi:hypothetical protein
MILFALLLALWVASGSAQAQQSQPGNCSGTATSTATPIPFAAGFPSRFLTITNPSTTATLWICASKGCTAAANAATSIALVPAGMTGQNRISFWRGALSPPAAVSILSSAAESPFTCLYDGADVPTYPLDAFTQPAAAYSMRRLKSTYTGPAIRLRRASDNAEADIGFLGFTGFTGAPLDTAAANAHCAATTCFIDIWYDQSGNGRNVLQPTAANQPAFIFNCVGTQPCARSTLNTHYMQSAAVTWASAISSFSGVGMRSVGAGACWIIQKGANNAFGFNNAANQWVVSDNIANFFPLAATDNVWHAGIGIIAGAASLGRIDTTEIAGSNIPGTSAANTVNVIYSAGGDTCNTTEAILWDGYALSLAERQVLTANQKSYWGF